MKEKILKILRDYSREDVANLVKVSIFATSSLGFIADEILELFEEELTKYAKITSSLDGLIVAELASQVMQKNEKLENKGKKLIKIIRQRERSTR